MLILSTNQLCTIVASIYLTEGGGKTAHPYGIMKSYAHTTAEQACANTVLHASRDTHEEKLDKEFIYFLSDRYCPRTADPRGNANWRRNMICLLKAKGLVLK